jgi:hypothetical protein
MPSNISSLQLIGSTSLATGGANSSGTINPVLCYTITGNAVGQTIAAGNISSIALVSANGTAIFIHTIDPDACGYYRIEKEIRIVNIKPDIRIGKIPK